MIPTQNCHSLLPTIRRGGYQGAQGLSNAAASPAAGGLAEICVSLRSDNGLPVSMLVFYAAVTAVALIEQELQVLAVHITQRAPSAPV
jgi:hypothetical protein